MLQETKGINELMMELLDRTLTDSDSVWIEYVTLNVDKSNREVKKYLESRKVNWLSENRSITLWLKCCESADDMTDVDTKPMPDKNRINGNLSDLAKDLTNSEDKEVWWANRRKVLTGNIPQTQLHDNKNNQRESVVNPEVPAFVKTNPQISDKKVVRVKKKNKKNNWLWNERTPDIFCGNFLL